MPAERTAPLSEQVALVTGAGRRLGAAVAQALARRCAKVILHYNRSGQQAEALAASIRRDGGRAETVQADLASAEQSVALLGQVSPVHVLVNSASVFPPDRFADIPAPVPEGQQDAATASAATGATAAWLERSARVLQVNAVAPLLLIRALATQAHPGQVVNVLDSRIAGYDPRHFSYGLSKELLHTLTHQLARELAPEVRVNAVAPGPILPPPGGDSATLRERARAVPLGRPGSPEDVVRAILFLAESPYVTGQVIYVDGGAHLAGGSLPEATADHGPGGSGPSASHPSMAIPSSGER